MIRIEDFEFGITTTIIHSWNSMMTGKAFGIMCSVEKYIDKKGMIETLSECVAIKSVKADPERRCALW